MPSSSATARCPRRSRTAALSSCATVIRVVGNDGRVVERGDFAITAGADDSACYAGSYLATWAPDGDAWHLQMLTWQDLETGLANCK
jgi:hypothetical protein